MIKERLGLFKRKSFIKLVCFLFGHNVFQTDPARWQCARCDKGIWKHGDW